MKENIMIGLMCVGLFMTTFGGLTLISRIRTLSAQTDIGDDVSFDNCELCA